MSTQKGNIIIAREPSEFYAFKGGDGKFGVGQGSFLCYEPDMSREVASRVAELLNNSPDMEWSQISEILESEGFSCD